MEEVTSCHRPTNEENKLLKNVLFKNKKNKMYYLDTAVSNKVLRGTFPWFYSVFQLTSIEEGWNSSP
jgi:hypothetical protein